MVDYFDKFDPADADEYRAFLVVEMAGETVVRERCFLSWLAAQRAARAALRSGLRVVAYGLDVRGAGAELVVV
jgi:hypothetical protein